MLRRLAGAPGAMWTGLPVRQADMTTPGQGKPYPGVGLLPCWLVGGDLFLVVQISSNHIGRQSDAFHKFSRISRANQSLHVSPVEKIRNRSTAIKNQFGGTLKRISITCIGRFGLSLIHISEPTRLC